MEFKVDLDGTDLLKSHRKGAVVRFLKKHLVEDRHFSVSALPPPKGGVGGRPSALFLLTCEAYALLESSYNLKHRYRPEKQERTIMSLENQTIGFIESAFKGVTPTTRQKPVLAYWADLCFDEHALILECDENGHADRDPVYEAAREDGILGEGFMMIRFNPNAVGFDIARVMNEVNRVIIGGQFAKRVVRL